MRVDDHHVDARVAGEAVYLGELLRVVDEVLHALAVFQGEMLLHGEKTLIYALSDGDAGHYDDKLGPAILLVQLKHGLDVGIGLARTRLHLDGEGSAHALQLLQMLYGAYALLHLDGTDILRDVFLRQDDFLVAKAFYVKLDAIRVAFSRVHHEVGESIALGLSDEGIHHTSSRILLESLVLIS